MTDPGFAFFDIKNYYGYFIDSFEPFYFFFFPILDFLNFPEFLFSYDFDRFQASSIGFEILSKMRRKKSEW